MDYTEVVNSRMQSKSNNPIDSLIKAGAGNIIVENFYTKEQKEVIFVEDDSDEMTDEKIMYTYYELFSEGDIVTWKDTNWILFQEELNTTDKYSKFFVIESLSNVRFYIDGIKSKEHPISFLNAKFGTKSPKSSSRYTTQENSSTILAIINKNNETEQLEMQNEIIINGSVWKIELINDYESQSIIVLGLVRVKNSNSDDLDNNIANTIDGIGGVVANDGTYDYIISGEPTISIGDYEEYEVVRIEENGNRSAPNSVVFSTPSSLVVLSQDNNIATINAQSDTGTFILSATVDGNDITTQIEITNYWG